MPTHQSSHERSIRSAGSYDDIENPAKLVTMGTVMVAFFEATAVDVSVVTMTSTLRRMRSATKPEITTLDPIRRIDTSVEDGWWESRAPKRTDQSQSRLRRNSRIQFLGNWRSSFHRNWGNREKLESSRRRLIRDAPCEELPREIVGQAP